MHRDDEKPTSAESKWGAILAAHRSGECLQAEELVALASGGRPRRAAGWLDHISVCPTCRAVYKQLLELEAVRSPGRLAWLRLPPAPVWRGALAVAAAACVFVVGYRLTRFAETTLPPDDSAASAPPGSITTPSRNRTLPAQPRERTADVPAGPTRGPEHAQPPPAIAHRPQMEAHAVRPTRSHPGGSPSRPLLVASAYGLAYKGSAVYEGGIRVPDLERGEAESAAAGLSAIAGNAPSVVFSDAADASKGPSGPERLDALQLDSARARGGAVVERQSTPPSGTSRKAAGAGRAAGRTGGAGGGGFGGGFGGGALGRVEGKAPGSAGGHSAGDAMDGAAEVAGPAGPAGPGGGGMKARAPVRDTNMAAGGRSAFGSPASQPNWQLGAGAAAEAAPPVLVEPDPGNYGLLADRPTFTFRGALEPSTYRLGLQPAEPPNGAGGEVKLRLKLDRDRDLVVAQPERPLEANRDYYLRVSPVRGETMNYQFSRTALAPEREEAVGEKRVFRVLDARTRARAKWAIEHRAKAPVASGLILYNAGLYADALKSLQLAPKGPPYEAWRARLEQQVAERRKGTPGAEPAKGP